MSERNILPLSARLDAVCALVRQGARIADVGTDHAYLPIRLLLEGRVSFAVASDIVDGPLQSAKKNISAFGLNEDRIALLKTDGLRGIGSYSPDDILICGMGGELIASILAASDYIRNRGVRLILQPMTREEKLRLFLSENGFEITEEKLVREGSRIYQIICAAYDGRVRSVTPVQALLGERNISRRTDEFYSLLEIKLRALKKKINGLFAAGKSDPDLITLAARLEEIRKEKPK